MTDAGAPASLAEALAALQAKMPPVGKHASGKVSGTSKAGNAYDYTYSYAPGEDIAPKLYPLMGALGLSFTAAPTMHEGRFVLEYALLHTSGQSRGPYWYPLPDPDRYGPQDLGKAETYARRYALNAVTGLFPGGDDSDADGMTETTAQSGLAPGGGMTTRQLKGATGAAQAPDPTRGASRAATTPQPRTGTAPAAGTSTSSPAARAGQRGKAKSQAGAATPEQRKRRIAEERARADTAGHDPAKVTRSRGKLEVNPWEARSPEERENAPGTVNDLQMNAIWMLLKRNAGITDPDSAHAMARTALGLPDDALRSDPDPETGEVRESFKRLSHAQAADFIKQLQDGSPG